MVLDVSEKSKIIYWLYFLWVHGEFWQFKNILYFS